MTLYADIIEKMNPGNSLKILKERGSFIWLDCDFSEKTEKTFWNFVEPKNLPTQICSHLASSTRTVKDLEIFPTCKFTS